MDTVQKQKLENIALLLLTSVFFVFAMYPFFIILISASKASLEIMTTSARLPTNWGQLPENIMKVWNSRSINYPASVWTSTVITTMSLLLVSLSASMAAWVLVRSKSKLAHVMFLVFVAGLVVPFQVVMFPLVQFYRVIFETLGLRMLRTYHGIIFAYIGFGAPLAVFMFHGFMKSVPLELEEAATIDGCSKPAIFFRIIVPILKPIFVTVLVLNVLWIWNDYLLPSLVLGLGQKLQTVPLAIQAFAGSFVKKWDLIMTAVLMAAIPIIVFFLLMQKHVIKGMVAGSIK
ncbi:carbohydrate ABC transporter permease [Candidatus Haliotispira prima]|uniref:Carbohydrate ABC transporter permease n=1 Tax=Candidatus Haliotispira prima TaxID=3034016 RepID=A0ABY8MFZ9_9SPIO|nr:carbohydrate ABC transporter permease [Candidatus Haliotispira prima]